MLYIHAWTYVLLSKIGVPIILLKPVSIYSVTYDYVVASYGALWNQ